MSNPTENDILELEKHFIMMISAVIVGLKKEFDERHIDSDMFGAISHVALLSTIGINMFYTDIDPDMIDDYLSDTLVGIRSSFESFSTFKREKDKPSLKLVN